MGKLRSSFRIILFSLAFFLLLFIIPSQIVAGDTSLSCSDRYLTLVNPVRDRSLWGDPTLKPLIDQYSAIKKYSFPATWLLQYDTFDDPELTSTVNSFDSTQEKGLFIEVSRKLTYDSGVEYPIYLRWSNPGAVFLSAYAPSERKKIIDQAFFGYKNVFGSYPKSVGAWWIDSYSLNYMKEKYDITSVLIVADQKVTDSYGVWGQWWGFAYKPSKANILTPAQNTKNLQDVVVLQWAQRDPVLAYGGVGTYSRYSLQANDYVAVDKDINYFKKLSSQYLDCKNELGQITVGLETGMESIMEPIEYGKQLEYLATVDGLNAVTMSNFYQKFSALYNINPDKVLFGEGEYTWEMTPMYRKNTGLREEINYDQSTTFSDYFVRDNSDFLDRVMPLSVRDNKMFPWFMAVALILFAVSLRLKLYKVWIVSLLSSFLSYGLILRSGNKLGWEVFYGPEILHLPIMQVLAIIIPFWVILGIHKIFKSKINLWLFPLAFGIDRLISFFRYTSIDGSKYFGIAPGKDTLYGIRLLEKSLSPIAQKFDPIQFHSLIKFDFSRIWQDKVLYLLVYPLVHLVLAFILSKILVNVPKKVRILVYVILSALVLWQMIAIFTSDPLSVIPIA